MRLLCIFVAIFAVSQAISDDQHRTLWNSFKNVHNKVYSNKQEEKYRFGIFKTNIAVINKHNSEAEMGVHSYTLGVNQFADLTHDEFATKMLGGVKIPTDPLKRPVGQRFNPPANVEIPASIDWRTKGAVISVIENQEQCGSCWAFTATGALEGQHFIKTGHLVRLSAQNLMDCSGKYGNMGCNGGLMDASFEYIKANDGIDTADSYPYEAQDGKCRFTRANVGATDTGFVDLPEKNETALQIALATVGPISVAIDASQNSFQFYKSGVYDESKCSSTNIDHSFVLVGYGTLNNKEYYIAKNSWGDAWGDKGYVLMSRNKNNQCGIANIGSYPLV
ncbi:unnamed protein product [Adineta ricciae]|uniref:Cathepsin L n=1 Tax=Adineta ricciae TaxID=249248 RepID=A0A815JLF5_ADIRI|nr:unnamed protein product [Adineta ricciae]